MDIFVVDDAVTDFVLAFTVLFLDFVDFFVLTFSSFTSEVDEDLDSASVVAPLDLVFVAFFVLSDSSE